MIIVASDREDSYEIRQKSANTTRATTIDELKYQNCDQQFTEIEDINALLNFAIAFTVKWFLDFMAGKDRFWLLYSSLFLQPLEFPL